MSGETVILEDDEKEDVKPAKSKVDEKPVEEVVAVEKEPVTKPVEKDEDDEEDDETTKAEGAETETDDERRERRRKEKADRKERRESAIRRNKMEMDYLRTRNDDLERRINGIETQTVKQQLNTVDAHLAQAKKEFDLANQVIAKAIAAGNGADAQKAMDYRDEARSKFERLTVIKQQAEQQVAQPQRQAEPQVPKEIVKHAQKFMNENDWYDPQGSDEDSAVVLAIDNALAREGFDPKTSEYWTELRKRAGRRLPERFTAAVQADVDLRKEKEPTRTPRGGPQMGNGKDGGGGTVSGRREVYISPERKQAMIEAGIWDDPVLRQRMVKRYAEYDRDKPNQN